MTQDNTSNETPVIPPPQEEIIPGLEESVSTIAPPAVEPAQPLEVVIPPAIAMELRRHQLAPTDREALVQSIREYAVPTMECIERSKAIVVTDATQVSLMKKAREARLTLKQLRVAADKSRRALGDDALRKKQAIDGCFALLRSVIEPEEERLLLQEQFAERAEQARLEKLALERRAECLPYVETSDRLNVYDFAKMDPQDYADLRDSLEASYKRKVQEEALRKEAEARERRRQQDEIERLSKLKALVSQRMAKVVPLLAPGAGLPPDIDVGDMDEAQFAAFLEELQDAKEVRDIEAQRQRDAQRLGEVRMANLTDFVVLGESRMPSVVQLGNMSEEQFSEILASWKARHAAHQQRVLEDRRKADETARKLREERAELERQQQALKAQQQAQAATKSVPVQAPAPVRPAAAKPESLAAYADALAAVPQPSSGNAALDRQVRDEVGAVIEWIRECHAALRQQH